jgi:poly(3-hydroxyalkanoate) depolymerase
VLPVIGDYWEKAELPWPLLHRLGELGLVGDGIEGYGCPPMGSVAAGLVNMELNRGDGSLGTFAGVQGGLAMQSIAMLGSEEQEQRWLPEMARVDKLGAFALTEPDHGSDSVALETTATPDGDTWVITGQKTWIGNGSIADVVVLWARDTIDGQVKGFLVEKGTPGYDVVRIDGKVSLRSVWLARITLTDARVPEANRLPGARTFKDAARVLAGTRKDVAWAALGHATAAYERTSPVSGPSPDPSTGAADQRFLDVDGVRLRVSVRGIGQPLLLITGLGAGLDLAEPFETEMVARGFQVISFDSPGVGQSTGYRWPRRMPGVARTIEDLLDALGHRQVDVLGVSLGGVIAHQLAHQAPDRVRKLVLCATGAGVVGLGGVPGSPRAMLEMATPRRYHSPDHYRSVAGRLYGGAARQDPDALLHGTLARFARPPNLAGYLGQLYAISFWTGLPWLCRLTQPTLVLSGDDDPIVPPANGRILARCIPDARLHIVPGGGHLFILERPAEIADLTTHFLRP